MSQTLSLQPPTTGHSGRVAELVSRRQPFVRATVVRAQQPTSAHTGDQAIVLADGTIEGFVGGHCAAGTVKVTALDALTTGKGILLRVLPEDYDEFPETPGALVAVNPCLSGGALEIFLEPVLPKPIVHVFGSSPIARELRNLAGQVGFELSDESGSPMGAVAAIISSHGGEEPTAIRAALDNGVPFIGIVASPKRGASLVEEAEVTDEERARVHTPVGIEIGAETPAEVALSILGAIIKSIRTDGIVAHPEIEAARTGAKTAIDPICKMTVVINDDAIHAVVKGEDYYFCAPGCRDAWVAMNA